MEIKIGTKGICNSFWGEERVEVIEIITPKKIKVMQQKWTGDYCEKIYTLRNNGKWASEGYSSKYEYLQFN